MIVLILLQILAFTQAKELADAAVNTDSDLDNVIPTEKVKFVFLYETGCPYSVSAYIALNETYAELGPYLDIHTYPFGNANMIVNGSQMTIECQHGESECYGNRLHACAVDALREPAEYIPFNACMMRYAVGHNPSSTSDDESADVCGEMLNVNSTKIKSCAKDYHGFLLHLQYGVKTNETHYPRRVPWWYINGVERHKHPEKETGSLKDILCSAFEKYLPAVCKTSNDTITIITTEAGE